MAKKVKFDQDATFKSIVGIGMEPSSETGSGVMEQSEKKSPNDGKPPRVQRAYYLDRDIEKALRRKALEEEINLTQAVNNALRLGLANYL